MNTLSQLQILISHALQNERPVLLYKRSEEQETETAYRMGENGNYILKVFSFPGRNDLSKNMTEECLLRSAFKDLCGVLPLLDYEIDPLSNTVYQLELYSQPLSLRQSQLPLSEPEIAQMMVDVCDAVEECENAGFPLPPISLQDICYSPGMPFKAMLSGSFHTLSDIEKDPDESELVSSLGNVLSELLPDSVSQLTECAAAATGKNSQNRYSSVRELKEDVSRIMKEMENTKEKIYMTRSNSLGGMQW